MSTYSVLAALPAIAYLNPENFGTTFDGWSSWLARDKQYLAGLDVGDKATEIHIGVNSVWSAHLKDGGHLSSYEGIGYHAHTKALLQGFLDSDCKIFVHRLVDDKIKTTQIK